MREVVITSILKELDQKKYFFQGWSWFKFSNLGLTLRMALKFYTSANLKIRRFWRLISTFVEVTGEKLVGAGMGVFLSPPPILNRVKCTK